MIRRMQYAVALYLAVIVVGSVALAYRTERARVRAMVADTRASLEGQGQALVLRMAYARSGEDNAATGPGWESAS